MLYMVENLDACYVAVSIASQKKQTAVTASLLSKSKDIDSSTVCQVCAINDCRTYELNRKKCLISKLHSTDNQTKNQVCLALYKVQLSGY